MNKKCTRCRWHNNDFVNCTSFFGNPNADIIFGGEAFGRQEAEQGIAFVGDAGKKLNYLLKLAGFQRDEVAIMNAMRCYLPRNPTPNKGDMDNCFIHSFMDIKKIKPKLFVAMGESALYQYGGRSGIKMYQGKVFWSDKIECNVFATYHPAASIYDPSKWDILVEDFKRLKSLLNNPTVKPFDYKYKVIQTIKDFEGMVVDVWGKSLYFDIEATGLNPYEDELTQIQIAVSEDLIYVIEGDMINSLKEDLAILFSRHSIIGQGMDFDAKFIYTKLGVFPNKWKYDSCLAEYIISGMLDNNLRFLTSKYAPDSFGYDDAVVNVGGAHKVRDKEVLRQYGANDVGVLFPIRKRQYKSLVKEDKIDLLENITLQASRILTKMSLHGIKYDIDLVNKTDELYARRAEKILNQAMNLESVKTCERSFGRLFNPRSPQMVRWLLIDHYNLPVLKETKGKQPAVSMKEMLIYANKFDNEYCQIMEHYRSYHTIRDNFLSGVLPKLIDGVAHTSYSSHSTTTGRPNSKNPNVLNIPRNKEIKSCIIARPGCKFVCSDEAQLEVRIASVVYDEPRLIEISNDFEKDMHSNVTSVAFKIPYDEIYSGYKAKDEAMTELRVRGKGVQFGVIYQQSAVGLAANINVPVEEAEGIIEEYYNNFPDLAKNIETTKRLLLKQGYLDNYFGFRRRWKLFAEEDQNAKFLREGVNFLVQSLAWNILQLAMIQIDEELDKRGLNSKLVMQVYDSLVAECPEEEVDEVAHLFKDIMQNVNQPYENINRVLLKSDVEVGYNLADLEDYII